MTWFSFHVLFVVAELFKVETRELYLSYHVTLQNTCIVCLHSLSKALYDASFAFMTWARWHANKARLVYGH